MVGFILLNHLKIMTITFFTNLINHHQVPVADEFYHVLRDKYTFVTTIPMTSELINNGYPDYSDKPYLLKAYESDKNQQKALELGLESDIVIMGSAPDIYIEQRLKANKITFRYSERWFKKIDYHLFSPRAWFHWFNSHTKYRNKQLYMLCASAYTANDVSKIFAYPNKCFKWGYFTDVQNLNVNQVLENKRQDCFKMLWVARWLDWKHPELPIKLAYELKQKGYNFQISMAGSGPLQEEMKSLCHSLDVEDCISFIGNMPNNDIIHLMQRSNALLFTSDRNEGWGAVLNEAMSNGCTVVASHLIGSVPFLVQNGKNGLIFKSENLESLVNQVEELLNNRIYGEELAINAYQTMSNEWSPRHAAQSFFKLSSSLLEGRLIDFQDGPCSKAFKTKIKDIL